MIIHGIIPAHCALTRLTRKWLEFIPGKPFIQRMEVGIDNEAWNVPADVPRAEALVNIEP